MYTSLFLLLFSFCWFAFSFVLLLDYCFTHDDTVTAHTHDCILFSSLLFFSLSCWFPLRWIVFLVWFFVVFFLVSVFLIRLNFSSFSLWFNLICLLLPLVAHRFSFLFLPLSTSFTLLRFLSFLRFLLPSTHTHTNMRQQSQQQQFRCFFSPSFPSDLYSFYSFLPAPALAPASSIDIHFIISFRFLNWLLLLLLLLLLFLSLCFCLIALYSNWQNCCCIFLCSFSFPCCHLSLVTRLPTCFSSTTLCDSTTSTTSCRHRSMALAD